MAWAHVATGAFAESASAGASIEIPAPTGSGGALLMVVRAQGATIALTTEPPTGWIRISDESATRIGLYGRVSDGGDNDSPTIAQTGTVVGAVIARWSGGPSTISTLADILAYDGATGCYVDNYKDAVTNTLPTDSLTAPDNNDCLVIYAMTQHAEAVSPLTSYPNSSTALFDLNTSVGGARTFAASYTIQTTAAAVNASSFADTSGLTGYGYTLVAALLPGVSLTKKLKLLVHPSAAGATGVSGVVWATQASNIAGNEYGEFTGKSFEATTEGAGVDERAVLKIPLSDVGSPALNVSDTAVALVRNTTHTTGAISGTVIEE